MTKAEARRMSRLEAESKELRDTIARLDAKAWPLITEACALRVAFKEIEEVIAASKEFAR